MNKTKSSNPVRLIAFFLTTFILVCTFGFTVDGWKIGAEDEGGAGKVPSQDSDTNNITPDSNENNTDQPTDEPEIIIPEYINRITGLETSEALSKKAHIAFVMNPSLPSYGISATELLCEIPIENGDTRMVAFVPDFENLWKIGSLTCTRGYISNIVKYFEAVCVSAGNDDSKYYTQCNIVNQHFDLSVNNSYKYTEFTENVYTNRDLLNSGLKELAIDPSIINAPTLPFEFVDFGEDAICYGDKLISSVTVKYDSNSTTELKYNDESKKYSLYNNGSIIIDSMNGKAPEFENCFVLFADSITYDNSECSQMIMDTIGKGQGYYFSQGGVCPINWIGSGDGVMTFYSEDGQRLIANRGSTYIAFVKSSKTDSVSYK